MCLEILYVDVDFAIPTNLGCTMRYIKNFLSLLLNLYFTICPAGHLVNVSNLITK